MTHTHQYLKASGYAGAILSPAEESLFHFYGKMGYKTCAYANELHYTNTQNLVRTSEQKDILKTASIENVMNYFYKVECLEIRKKYGSLFDRF